jgi:hypothetical protein
MSFEPLFRATPVPRACGERTPGGLYIESGLGPGGAPLEAFLLDPPLPVPLGLDLVNKPQVIADAETGVAHLLVWVGAEWYSYLPDYLEETREWGASRKLSPFVDISRLTPSSRLILAHPLALNMAWREQTPPLACFKQIPGHEGAHSDTEEDGGWNEDGHEGRNEEGGAAGSSDPLDGRPKWPRQSAPRSPSSPQRREVSRLLTLAPQPDERPAEQQPGGGQALAVLERERPTPIDGTGAGPCLFKTYNLMPIEASDGKTPRLVVNGHTYYRREIASTAYLYAPSGEPSNGLIPGVFAALPITGFALIRRADGSVNEQAEAKLQRAGLPYYSSEK